LSPVNKKAAASDVSATACLRPSISTFLCMMAPLTDGIPGINAPNASESCQPIPARDPRCTPGF
jgi:hypothetical protein